MNLSEVLLLTADLLGLVHRSTATGGTNGSVIDSALNERTNWFADGTIFFLSGDLAGKTAVITGNNGTTITFPAQSSAVKAGDLYAASRGVYNRAQLVSAINLALQDVGQVTQYNQSLTQVDGQSSYTLPAGISNLVRVDIAQNATEPYEWKRSHYWEEIGGALEFDRGKAPTNTGAPLRLWYNAPHEPVNQDSDPISPVIAPMRLAWTAALYAATDRAKLESNDERLGDFIKMAQTESSIMAVRYPIRNYAIDPHLSNL